MWYLAYMCINVFIVGFIIINKSLDDNEQTNEMTRTIPFGSMNYDSLDYWK